MAVFVFWLKNGFQTGFRVVLDNAKPVWVQTGFGWNRFSTKPVWSIDHWNRFEPNRTVAFMVLASGKVKKVNKMNKSNKVTNINKANKDKKADKVN